MKRTLLAGPLPLGTIFFLVIAFGSRAWCQQPADAPKPAEPAAQVTEAPATPAAKSELVPLDAVNAVWLDSQRKRVVMVGEVCLRTGQLELFACLKRSKEHESIVAVETKAFTVHAGLLACGAVAGNPARFAPTYQPATGSEIEVTLFWTDDKGQRQRARAQDWVRDTKTGKEMQQPWVFGGSGFYEDEQTKERHYLAEDGDFICVSNFPSAMLDVPVESTAVNEALQFEAFTDRIPPKGTRVTIVLTPRPDKKDAAPKGEEKTNGEKTPQ